MRNRVHRERETAEYGTYLGSGYVTGRSQIHSVKGAPSTVGSHYGSLNAVDSTGRNIGGGWATGGATHYLRAKRQSGTALVRVAAIAVVTLMAMGPDLDRGSAAKMDAGVSMFSRTHWRDEKYGNTECICNLDGCGFGSGDGWSVEDGMGEAGGDGEGSGGGSGEGGADGNGDSENDAWMGFCHTSGKGRG